MHFFKPELSVARCEIILMHLEYIFGECITKNAS